MMYDQCVLCPQGLQDHTFCSSFPLSVLHHAKGHEGNEGDEEGQKGRRASTSHEGDESHEVRCLTQEMIKGVALEADEGR